MTGHAFKEAIDRYIAKSSIRGKQYTYVDIARLLKINKKELYRRFRSKGLYEGWVSEAEIILHLDAGESNEHLPEATAEHNVWALLKQCTDEKRKLQKLITELQHQLQAK